MKITKRQLRQIIKEELSRISESPPGSGAMRQAASKTLDMDDSVKGDSKIWVAAAHGAEAGKAKINGKNIPWEANGKKGCISLKNRGGTIVIILQVGDDCEGKEPTEQDQRNNTAMAINVTSTKEKKVVEELKADVQSAVEKNLKWLNDTFGRILAPSQ